MMMIENTSSARYRALAMGTIHICRVIPSSGVGKCLILGGPNFFR